MSNTYPECKSAAYLKEVVYGMPDGPLDDFKYVTGGCCVSEMGPVTTCIWCGPQDKAWTKGGLSRKESFGRR